MDDSINKQTKEKRTKMWTLQAIYLLLFLHQSHCTGSLGCQEEPDLGTQDQMVFYEWNGSKVANTIIRYTCRAGTAFDGLYVVSTEGSCTTQTSGSAVLSWKYNAINPLPSCIRKFFSLFFLLHESIFFFSILFQYFSRNSRGGHRNF